jgi:hypothetical protein
MEAVFDQLQYHGFAFIIGLIATVLLLRTYTGKAHSRFLLHLAIAFGIISLTHLLDVGLSTLNLFSALPLDQVKRFSEKVDLLLSEPIREVSIHDEAFAAASRLSMMRIMAKRTNAATVVA